MSNSSTFSSANLSSSVSCAVWRRAFSLAGSGTRSPRASRGASTCNRLRIMLSARSRMTCVCMRLCLSYIQCARANARAFAYARASLPACMCVRARRCVHALSRTASASRRACARNTHLRKKSRNTRHRTSHVAPQMKRTVSGSVRSLSFSSGSISHFMMIYAIRVFAHTYIRVSVW